MVTIGIPVYNCAKELIQRCVSSALSQSVDDLEVLLVNDCCTDQTMDYVAEAISQHPKGQLARIINHEKNTGIAGSRNTILDEAHGDYIFFSDCDDFITPDAIEKLLAKATEYEAEAVWGSVASTTYETGEEAVYWQYPDEAFIGEDKIAYYAHHDSRMHMMKAVWNILISMDFIRRNNLRFESYSYFDDYVFQNRMLPLLSRAVLTSDLTYYWMIRKGSQSHPKETVIPNTNQKQAIVANKVLKDACRALRGKPYYEGYCLKLHKDCFFTAYTMVKHRKRFDHPFTAKEIKDILKPVETLHETLQFKRYRKENLAFCLLGSLPAFILPPILRFISKHR